MLMTRLQEERRPGALLPQFPWEELPSLWTRSYFAATAGNVSAETIKKYIEAQKGI